jgi:hypothetical protein
MTAGLTVVLPRRARADTSPARLPVLSSGYMNGIPPGRVQFQKIAPTAYAGEKATALPTKVDLYINLKTAKAL